jgi:hypothetical protein
VEFIRNTASPRDASAALEVLPGFIGNFRVERRVVGLPSGGQTAAEKTVEWEGTAAVWPNSRRLNDRQSCAAPQWKACARRRKPRGSRLRELFARETDLDCKRTILRALGGFKDPAAKELILSTLDNSQADRPLLVEAIAAGEEIAGSQLVPALVRL